jgi:hypothetical protein
VDIGEDRYTEDYFNFFGPIVKLRWNFIELTYRGLLGINEGWFYDEYNGNVINWGHQIMIGIYFETSKRAR